MALGGAFHNLAGILNLENEDNYPNIRKLFEIARTRTRSAEANLNCFRYQEVENQSQNDNDKRTKGELEFDSTTIPL